MIHGNWYENFNIGLSNVGTELSLTVTTLTNSLHPDLKLSLLQIYAETLA